MPLLERSEEFQLDLIDLECDFLCFPPESVLQAEEGLQFPRSILNPLTTEREAREKLLAGGYTIYQDLELPTSHGRLDFKAIHEPLVTDITERSKALLSGLSGFEHQYVTGNGSTEAIQRLMSAWIGSGKMTRLGILKGDYPGYEIEALAAGLPEDAIDEVDSLEAAGDSVEGRIFFISNPSAIDGNRHDTESWQSFVKTHKVVVDAAYMDLDTLKHPLDVSDQNIEAILTSPGNKPFGTVLERSPGIAYTREFVFSLFIARGYRPISRIITMAQLNRMFPPHEIALQHTAQQLTICSAIGGLASRFSRGDESLNIEPSHTYLMAHTEGELPPEFDALAKSLGKYSFRLSTAYAQLAAHNRAQNAA